MANRPVSKENSPLFGLSEPEKYIHECSLARAVLTNERVDLATIESKIHGSVSHNSSGITLGYPIKTNKRFSVVSHIK
jgi:hypothetical protein